MSIKNHRICWAKEVGHKRLHVVRIPSFWCPYMGALSLFIWTLSLGAKLVSPFSFLPLLSFRGLFEECGLSGALSCQLLGQQSSRVAALTFLLPSLVGPPNFLNSDFHQQYFTKMAFPTPVVVSILLYLLRVSSPFTWPIVDSHTGVHSAPGSTLSTWFWLSKRPWFSISQGTLRSRFLDSFPLSNL